MLPVMKKRCSRSRFFHNVWTEVRKQDGLGKQLFVFNKEKAVFRQVMPLCVKQLMKMA